MSTKDQIIENLKKVKTITVDKVTYQLSKEDKEQIASFILSPSGPASTIELKAHQSSLVKPKGGKGMVFLEQIVPRVDPDTALAWEIQELADIF
jgi:hypothetical protein